MDASIKREHAWIGDSVLGLFAREWILKQADIAHADRSEVFIHMTSNKFLASFGEPTAMEAEIGLVYRKSGLQAAFDFIESKYIPIFQKQRNNKMKTGSYRTRKKNQGA